MSSADERLAALERQVDWLRSRIPVPLAGTFLDTASSPGDDIRVLAPRWDDGEHAFGPVRWSPIGNALPQAGDECVIMERDDGVWQVVAWWNESQDTGVASSALDALDGRVDTHDTEIAALDTRLDTLEATRTVRGIVDATGGTPLIVEGSEFSMTDLGTGVYRINFSPVFSDVPSVVMGAHNDADASNRVVAKLSLTASVTASSATLFTYRTDTNALLDASFHFIAVGPA